MPNEERRLVTTLFCDLVGFTPLSERLDPEEVRDIQADYFRAMSAQVARYQGTTDKYAGDAVLALFGTPVVHEDDAERAVLCALGMQEAIEQIASSIRRRGMCSRLFGLVSTQGTSSAAPGTQAAGKTWPSPATR